MSLTKATYSMISGAVFNVLDYGAIGNGVADDTTAIQATINAALASQTTNAQGMASQSIPGTVYFPAGTFLVSGITLPAGFLNIVLQGTGPSSVLSKKSGSTTAVITLQGDTTTLNSNDGRVLEVFIRDLAISGNSIATIGIYCQKIWRCYFDNLLINACTHGIYLIGSSEYYINNCNIYGLNTGSSIYNNGSQNPAPYGTPIALVKGFCEDFTIQNCWLGYGLNSLTMNHCEGADVKRCYFSPYARSAILINSSGGGAGTTDDSAAITIQDCWFEGDSASGYGIIEIQSNDTLNVYGVIIQNNAFATLSLDTTKLVQAGFNSTGTGKVGYIQVVQNTLNYSATALYPAWLNENPDLGYNNIVRDNWPIGGYGGVYTAPNRAYPEFSRLVYSANDVWNNTADANPWSPTGWTASGSGVKKLTYQPYSYLGYSGPSLGDSSATGELTFAYTLDVSQYRNKVIMISFMVASNTASCSLSLFPNSAEPSLTANDVMDSRLAVLPLINSADTSGLTWRRKFYFVPINVSPSSGTGAGGFGNAFASTLGIRFTRPAGTAATLLLVADFNIYATDKSYAYGAL